MFWPYFFYTWGCIPEITKNCQDMTNASSTYLGIVGGAIIGAIVSWWIYNRQKKTSEMQDSTLNRIKELDEKFFRPTSVSGCFNILPSTSGGNVTTSAPIFAASTTCIGCLTLATKICVLNL